MTDGHKSASDAGKPRDTLIVSDALPLLGTQEGDNWVPEGQHDTHQAPEGRPNPGGTGDGGAQAVGDLDAGEGPVKVHDILERFAGHSKLALKDEVRKDYGRAFRRFSEDVRLGDYSRRQVLGPTGKRLILSHLEKIPKASRRWVTGAIKAVWMYGIDAPWPIDTRRDLGRLPKPQRGRTPHDADVRPWAEAVRAEKDPYTKLTGIFLLQFGWRPSQVCRLKWRNVEYDPEGRPKVIIASGSVEDFKTDSDIRVWLPPNVVEGLVSWKSVSPDSAQERPILPRKGTTGRLPITPTKMHDRHSFANLLMAFESKWGLKHLTAKSLRHFVATKCREAGLSYQASAYWQGHDPSSSGAMRDWYDNPDDTFAEQSAKLPEGPMGLLEASEVRLQEGLPNEAVSVLTQYLNGKVGTMELVGHLEALKLKTNPTVQDIVSK